MSEPVLRVESLRVEGRVPAGDWVPIVEDISFDVAPGEVVALIGESGAGKSTLGLAALGYARPGTRFAGGRVLLDGIDLLGLDIEARRALRGRRVAYVAQSASAALNPALSIGEQAAESLVEHANLPRAEARDRVAGWFRQLHLPDVPAILARYPHEISGGQQQRVMIAMAMVADPDLVVFDEPTTALDVTTQLEVIKAIRTAIRGRSKAAVYVSHDLAVVAQLADRIIVMRNGRCVERGSTAEILNAAQHPYTQSLLKAVRTLRGAGSREIRSPQPADEVPLLQIDDIVASYGKRGRGAADAGQHALDGIDLAVHAGEVVALVGESGSGKSTLARVISGLHSPLSGEIRLRGVPLAARAGRRDRQELRAIQIVFQSPDVSLNPEQRIGEALSRPLQLYHDLPRRARAGRIAELLSMVGLSPDYAGRYPGEMSGGQRQRVALARAFAAVPDLIVCDEILSALDTVVAGAVLELLARLQRELSVAYLFISHDLATVGTIADRVVVLYAGRICEAGSVSRVFSPPFHPYTSLLLGSVPELRQGWLEDVLKDSAKDSPAASAPRDAGCAFRTRCPLRIEGTCDRLPPPPRWTAQGHSLFCHRTVEEL